MNGVGQKNYREKSAINTLVPNFINSLADLYENSHFGCQGIVKDKTMLSIHVFDKY